VRRRVDAPQRRSSLPPRRDSAPRERLAALPRDDRGLALRLLRAGAALDERLGAEERVRGVERDDDDARLLEARGPASRTERVARVEPGDLSGAGRARADELDSPERLDDRDMRVDEDAEEAERLDDRVSGTRIEAFERLPAPARDRSWTVVRSLAARAGADRDDERRDSVTRLARSLRPRTDARSERLCAERVVDACEAARLDGRVSAERLERLDARLALARSKSIPPERRSAAQLRLLSREAGARRSVTAERVEAEAVVAERVTAERAAELDDERLPLEAWLL
jgi:hypothetical protein